MAVPIKRGVEYDCPMFDVHCRQPCVSGGVRQTSKCPYDNYNKRPKIPKGYQATYAQNSGGGSTLVMITRDVDTNSTKGVTPKGAVKMADSKKSGGKNAAKGSGDFQPTFRKYKEMSESEQAAFRQGAKTSENKVKERLGLSKPKGK